MHPNGAPEARGVGWIVRALALHLGWRGGCAVLVLCVALAATEVETAGANSPASSPPSQFSEPHRAQLSQVPDGRKLALKLNDINGKPRELTPHAGSVVLVHFFATWCEPCRDELRSLERLAVAFAGRPLRTIAVDVGEPAARVRRFLEREKIAVRYPVLIDADKQAMRAWGVEILPTTYVLDPALCPLWKVAGALDWDIAPTSTTVETAVAALEREKTRSREESCVIKGGVR